MRYRPSADSLNSRIAMERMELNNRFIARQAILDSQSQCVGYELLYRNANQERAVFDDAGQASMQVFDSAYLFGIDTLCGESKAFVNCGRETLLSDFSNTNSYSIRT